MSHVNFKKCQHIKSLSLIYVHVARILNLTNSLVVRHFLKPVCYANNINVSCRIEEMAALSC